MSVRRLEREMARRGMHGRDLARRARVSEATISALRRGRPVSARTLRKVAVALAEMPELPAVARLLHDDD